MGTWHGSTTDQALYRLLDEADPGYMMRSSRTELMDKLKASGLIVDAPFYVPDMDELFGLKRTWSYYLAQGMKGARWVMCRETVEALARRYDRTRTAPPSEFDMGKELPSAALEMAVTTVMDSRLHWSDRATLFGVPVRIDPAARSPLFELDSEWTKGSERGTVR